MTIVLWIINAVLALAFLLAGGMKLAKTKDAYVAAGMKWAADWSPGTIKLIGVAEVLGAIGLILPIATGVALILTPIAAVCLVIIMAGATTTHLRRKESPAGALVLAVLATVSAVIGFVVTL